MYHSPQTTCTVWKMFGNIQRRFKHLNRIKSTIKLEMISFFHYYFAHSMVIAHAHSWSTFKLVGKSLWIKKQKNKKKSTMRTYYDRDSANLLNSCLVIMAMMLSLSHQNASKVYSSKASYE